MARRRPKAGRRKRQSFTLPVAVLAGFGPIVRDVVDGYKSAGISGAQHYLVGGVTGYDSNTGKFNTPWALTHFWLPVGAGLIAHKLAGRFGINRALGQAGVPILRL